MHKKGIKISVTLLIMCLLVGALSGCGTGISGKWKIYGVVTNGTESMFEDYIASLELEESNVKIDLEILESGTFSLNLFGDEINGTWKEEEEKYFLQMGGNDVEAVIESSVLKIPLSDEVTFEFKK